MDLGEAFPEKAKMLKIVSIGAMHRKSALIRCEVFSSLILLAIEAVIDNRLYLLNNTHYKNTKKILAQRLPLAL